jgi:hypothetical protein
MSLHAENQRVAGIRPAMRTLHLGQAGMHQVEKKTLPVQAKVSLAMTGPDGHD